MFTFSRKLEWTWLFTFHYPSLIHFYVVIDYTCVSKYYNTILNFLFDPSATDKLPDVSKESGVA